MAKKKVMYKNKEVVYYTSGENKDEGVWVNLTLRGGGSVTLKGEKATKIVKKLYQRFIFKAK